MISFFSQHPHKTAVSDKNVLGKENRFQEGFSLEEKGSSICRLQGKMPNNFFKAQIYSPHILRASKQRFFGGEIKEKMTGNTVPVWNAYFMLYLKTKSNVGSLPWHWKPCFPNPLKNKQEDFLTYFVLGYHILSQLCNKAF